MMKICIILFWLFQTEERRNKRRKDYSKEFKNFQGTTVKVRYWK